MEKILMIAYYYPPLGGAGVQRTLKFSKYLNNYGYNPVVLTVFESTFGTKDSSLLEEIPDNVLVYRTPAYSIMNYWPVLEKIKLHKLVSFIDQYLFIPDGKIIWQYKARKKAIEIIRKYNIKIIYTTSGPYSAHLLGMYLKRIFSQLKWIADFRDEWTTYPNVYCDPVKYNPLRLYFEKRMEKKVCKSADKIIVVSDKMKKNMISNTGIEADKFSIISNGYDPSDFLDLKKLPRDNNKFVISYNGSFYGYQNPEIFFRSVRELIDDGVIDENKLLLQFIGNAEIIIKSYTDLYNLHNVVNYLGYLEHKASLNVLYSSDALLLLVGNSTNTDSVYTGKIFEYARIMKPVLALVPPNGLAADFVRQTNIGIVAAIDEIREIKSSICKIYRDYFTGSHDYEINWQELQKYDRRELTAKLTSLIDELKNID